MDTEMPPAFPFVDLDQAESVIQREIKHMKSGRKGYDLLKVTLSLRKNWAMQRIFDHMTKGETESARGFAHLVGFLDFCLDPQAAVTLMRGVQMEKMIDSYLS